MKINAKQLEDELLWNAYNGIQKRLLNLPEDKESFFIMAYEILSEVKERFMERREDC